MTSSHDSQVALLLWDLCCTERPVGSSVQTYSSKPGVASAKVRGFPTLELTWISRKIDAFYESRTTELVVERATLHLYGRYLDHVPIRPR